eukprot:8346738-Prorocentrum_lima.AAC.1
MAFPKTSWDTANMCCVLHRALWPGVSQAGRRLHVHRQSAAASTHRTSTRNKGPIRHASALGRPVRVGMVCMRDLRAQGLHAQRGAPRRFQARHGVPASCGDCHCGAPRRGVL